MKRRTKRLIDRVAAVCLMLSGLGTAAIFGWKAYSMQQEYEIGDEAYDKLADLVKAEEEPDEDPASSAAEEIEGAVPTVDLEAAQEVNSDIVAWLNSPETVIDYPVCQREDNSVSSG